MIQQVITEAEPPVTVVDGETTHVASDRTGGVLVETLKEIHRAVDRLEETVDPFGGRYPSPAEAAGIVPMAPLRPSIVVRHWGRPMGLAGVLAMVGGAGVGVVTGTAGAPIAAVLAGLLAVAGGVARGTHEQETENAR